MHNLLRPLWKKLGTPWPWYFYRFNSNSCCWQNLTRDVQIVLNFCSPILPELRNYLLKISEQSRLFILSQFYLHVRSEKQKFTMGLATCLFYITNVYNVWPVAPVKNICFYVFTHFPQIAGLHILTTISQKYPGIITVGLDVNYFENIDKTKTFVSSFKLNSWLWIRIR